MQRLITFNLGLSATLREQPSNLQPSTLAFRPRYANNIPTLAFRPRYANNLLTFNLGLSATLREQPSNLLTLN
ncbi:hypothetical protein [Moorena producens]|uniref:hypothetical protein n=1 Tax=Moorena producens TaxID=1155739 RepID=UPI000A82CEB6|nr:hypothetical protein [Moorena producens]